MIKVCPNLVESRVTIVFRQIDLERHRMGKKKPKQKTPKEPQKLMSFSRLVRLERRMTLLSH